MAGGAEADRAAVPAGGGEFGPEGRDQIAAGRPGPDMRMDRRRLQAAGIVKQEPACRGWRDREPRRIGKVRRPGISRDKADHRPAAENDAPPCDLALACHVRTPDFLSASQHRHRRAKAQVRICLPLGIAHCTQRGPAGRVATGLWDRGQPRTILKRVCLATGQERCGTKLSRDRE